MSYQALYRKYRPQTFSDVVGQEHITETLKNELSAGKVTHAYLFTGTRGTGKTSTAKILAKAVNCLNPKNGDPCLECESCLSVANGENTDIAEIDAASNNSVDSIRELRDLVSFAPASSKYRVYIIDEVHMLTISAFNALLKTLEEPPEHVIFILATTEVHKLPATILSRCQRFDFRRIDSERICERIQYIAGKEGLTVTDGAASLIAAAADGGAREAHLVEGDGAARGARGEFHRALRVDAELSRLRGGVDVRPEEEELPSALARGVDHVLHLRIRVFAAGILVSVGRDADERVLRAQRFGQDLLDALVVADRASHGVEQRGAAAGHVVALGKRPNPLDRNAVVQDAHIVVEEHGGDDRLALAFTVALEQGVVAADGVRLETRHRPRLVDDEHELGKVLLCHDVASLVA